MVTHISALTNSAVVTIASRPFSSEIAAIKFTGLTSAKQSLYSIFSRTLLKAFVAYTFLLNTASSVYTIL